MESKSQSIRCLKILFVIYNTILFTCASSYVLCDILIVTILVIQQSTEWTLPEKLNENIPYLKNQMLQNHSSFVMISIQSYLAITGISSPVKLSISHLIQLFYYIYPVIYYIKFNDVRTSLIFTFVLIIFDSITRAVKQATKDEVKKREDFIWFVNRGLVNATN